MRRVHRWLGIASLFFVLVLATTGIALNHSDQWSLDQRFVSSSWLLNAYGVSAPPPGASYTDDGHRASLLGQRLYLDGREIAQDVNTLSGVVALQRFIMVATGDAGIVLTRDGQYVETIELMPTPESITQIGRIGKRPVVQSTLAYYIGDADLTQFKSASLEALDTAVWSEASPPSAAELQELEHLYRGRGVTLERVITDLHSGRIVGITGTLLMDVVAAILIFLSLTGLAVWLLPKSRQNRTDSNGRQK